MALESLKLLSRPVEAWRALADRNASFARRLVDAAAWALVPAVCWYVGITSVGWQIGDEPHIRMTPASALRICAAFYVAMIAGVLVLGYIVHWMSLTYAATTSTFAKGLTIVVYTATPFFLAGVLGLYPSLWIDITVGVVAGIYCVYLLYLGVPIVMKIPPERGFLFATAVIGAALVGIVAAMAGTALVWDFGAEPVFIPA